MPVQIEIILPVSLRQPDKAGAIRTPLELEPLQIREDEDVSWIVSSVGFPVFKVVDEDNGYYVLFKDLATAWGYPSSYQLINKVIKNTGIRKEDLVRVTNKELNGLLLSNELISSDDTRFSLFYTKLSTIYTLVRNKEVFFSDEDDAILAQSMRANDDEDEDVELEDVTGENNFEEDEDFEEDIVVKTDPDLTEKRNRNKSDSYETITIGQVFPHYGLISSNASLDYSFYNSLTPLTKLNYYKSLPNAFKFLPNAKISYSERELVLREHDYSELKLEESVKQSEHGKNGRKVLGKSRKHADADPNAIDLTDSVIPGQGYIQEFNVSHLCKVPTYYITSGTQQFSNNISSGFNSRKLNVSSNSSFMFNESIKTSKDVQQLIFSNEAETHNHSRYYYTKSYRGPGSGNYKDLSVLSKLHKIHTTNEPIKTSHKVTKQVIKPQSMRYNQNLKGLIHENFGKRPVDRILSNHRKFTEDYVNLEMLHSNVQFNLLVNTYREMSEDTWINYYKFKLTDFEQLGALERERNELEAQREYIRKYQEWQKVESERQEKLRLKSEKDRERKERIQNKKAQRQRENEEKRRRLQLEASFNDPFGHNDKNEQEDEFLLKSVDDIDDEDNSEESEVEIDLHVPLPPPPPVEAPQLEVLSRFTLPSFHPEVRKSLPIELRDSAKVEDDNYPSIKKVIRYTSSYGEGNNPEILNKIEIIKLPNSNSLGWDNLRKYKDEN